MARKKEEDAQHRRDLSGGQGERPPTLAGLGPRERERVREARERAPGPEPVGDPFASAYVSGELRKARGDPESEE